MEEFMGMAKKFLNQSATIHIYSFPHFTLEAFLAIVMFVIYGYLMVDVSHIARRTLRVRPNTIIRKKLKGDNSTPSSFSRCQQDTANTYKTYSYGNHPSTHLAYRRLSTKCSSHSQMGWIMPNIVEAIPSSCADDNQSQLFDNVASMSPSEYVKREKEKRMRDKKLQNRFESLTTLYGNVIQKKYSENTLQTQLDLAKETVQCAKISNADTMVSLPSEAMTKSLFDLLEKLVIPSSLNNPLPFNGDMTRLVLEAGDLNCKPPKSSEMIYGTPSSSSTSSSEVIKIDTRNSITNS